MPITTSVAEISRQYNPQGSYPVEARDVEYRRNGDSPLLLRVFQPQGPGPFPVLINLHGGGWRSTDRLRDAPVCEALAATGLCVASLDFRLAPEAPFPAPMEDINYAIRWLKLHAADFNATPAGIGVIGYSSGAHLSVLAALRPGYPAYAALPLAEDPSINASLTYAIASSTPIDLFSFRERTIAVQGSDTYGFEAYFGGDNGMRASSPQQIIESGEAVRLTPLMILQPAVDDRATLEAAVRFTETYGKAGGNVNLVVLPETPHMYLNPDLAERGEGMVRAMAAIPNYIASQFIYQAAPFEG